MVRTTFAMAFLLTMSAGAYAQTEPTKQGGKEDLTDLNLDDLSKIQVTTASKKAESLFGVAAAIYVVTAEDIKRSGATNIPEALRMVPGVQVAQLSSRNYAVSVRGFNSQYTSNLLVLIDGRSIYNTFFGGVYWEDQVGSVDEIERIEVIRGPGGSLWGANAVNGIINIITKHTKDTEGWFASVDAGDRLNTTSETLRYGAKTNNGSWRVNAYGLRKADTLQSDYTSNNDAWDGGRISFRYDAGADTSRRMLIEGDTFRFNLDDKSIGGNFLAKFDWDHKDGSSTTLQSYYSKEHRNFASTIITRATTLDFDLQHALATKGANSVTTGIGYRSIADDYTSAMTVLTPSKDKYSVLSLFAQDDIKLTEKSKVTVGVKAMHNDFTGWEYQPNAKYSIQPDDKHAYWFSVGRAVQTPTRAAANLNIIEGATMTGDGLAYLTLEGTKDIKSVGLLSFEAGTRRVASKHLTLEGSVFHNEYSDITGEFTEAPYLVGSQIIIPTRIRNAGKATSNGIELDANYQPMANWKVNIAYNYLTANVPAASSPINAPMHQVKVLSSYTLNSKLTADQGIYFNSADRGSGVPSYTKFDLQCRYKAAEGLDIAVGGRNLFLPTAQQFGGALASAPATFVQPELFVKASWKF